ncbi:hypothetical protein [Gallaecimonas pentaromativorans]|uniref:hypothetical protein n=1 Tax=Gallaecimonas pentaromativorans TaxID=584787 RepID=UPI003A8FEFF9
MKKVISLFFATMTLLTAFSLQAAVPHAFLIYYYDSPEMVNVVGWYYRGCYTTNSWGVKTPYYRYDEESNFECE